MSETTRPTITLSRPSAVPMGIDNTPDALMPAPMFAAADTPWQAFDYLREDYVYAGQLVWAPYWHHGTVLGYAAARVKSITVTVRDGVADPWVVVTYANGSEQGFYLYSVVRWGAVAAVGSVGLPL